jgi:hypothetical protein
MPEQLEERAIQELVKFANSQNKVTALYNGTDPEEISHRVFYFLINGSFDSEFSDRLSDLDLRIANEIGYECDLMEWPCLTGNASSYPFLGNCIWKR